RLLRRRLLPLVSAAAFETHLSPSPNPFSQCRTPTKTLNQESFPSDSFRESGVEVIVLILSINSGKILGEEVDQRLRCSLRSDLASICCPSLISVLKSMELSPLPARLNSSKQEFSPTNDGIFWFERGRIHRLSQILLKS
ncbi:unnamed protein product, partial [Musa textilis]